MVDNLISYFENINDSMDSTRASMTRKATDKAATETNSSRVRRFISDLTELKRPSSKHKVLYNASEKARTLPRTSKDKDGETSNFKAKRDNVVKCTVTTNATEEHHKFMKYGHDEIKVGKLQEIRDNFEQKRVLFQQQHTQEYQNASSRVQLVNSNETKLLQNMQIKDEVSDEVDDSDDVSNVSDGAENSDDMFGFNDFDENQDDNYIIETYNKVGEELIIANLQITRRTITQTKSNEDVKKLMHDSDYVVHRNEYYCLSTDDEDYEDSNEHYMAMNQGITFDGQSSYNFLDHSSTVVYENMNSEVSSFSEESDYYEQIASPKNGDCSDGTDESVEIRGPSRHSTYDFCEKREAGDNFFHNLMNFTETREDVVDFMNEEGTSSDSTKKEKINYILEEIIKTEEQYISGLKTVVEDYIPYIYAHTTQDLIGKTTYLFGNIEQIYKNAKEFLNLMKTNEKNYDSIAQIFIDSASEFELYPLYSKNKPTADIYLKRFDPIIKQKQRHLKDKLGLASHLLTPIQRLGKYVLLLENIQKELTKAGKPSNYIENAINVVRRVMKKGNDYIAIDSIKNSSIDLTMQGSFIIRAPFNIIKPKKFISMVFLFENVIVFTEKTAKNIEQFKYVDSIQLGDLSLGKFEEKPTIFHLTNYTKSKRANPDATYVLEADSPKMKNEWTSAIEKKLWDQLEKAKEQQKKSSLNDHRHVPKSSLRFNKNNSNNPKVYRTRSKSKSTFYET